MAQGSLGSLVLSLAVDTARFEGDLGRAATIAERRMSNIKDTASKALGALAVYAGAAGAALTQMVRSSLQDADQLNKLSKSVGITVENLSGLKYAAELADIGVEDLSTGLTRLIANAADTARGTGESRKAFDALGISVTRNNGVMKNGDELLSEIAGRFSEIPDSAEKTALAVDLFGRAGAKMIPLLNEGADGLEKFKQEAQKMGLVISTDTAQASERFNDNITRLKLSVTGFGNNVTAQLLPTLESLSNILINNVTNLGGVGRAAELAASGLRLLLTSGTIIVTVFDTLGKALGGIGAALVALASGQFRQSLTIIKEATGDFLSTTRNAATTILDIWDETATAAADAAPKQAAQLSSPIVAAQKETSAALSAYILDLQRAYDTRQALIEASDAGISEGLKESTKVIESNIEAIGDKSMVVEGTMSEFARSAAQNMQTHFANFLFDPFESGVKGMLKGFVDTIRRMAAEIAASKVFEFLGSKSGTGGVAGFIGSLFGGFKASGGPVSAGKSYVVGEQGPEVFRPTSSGQIIPNGQVGSSPVISITTHIDARGATADLVKALPEVLKRRDDALESKIVDGLRRGRYGV